MKATGKKKTRINRAFERRFKNPMGRLSDIIVFLLPIKIIPVQKRGKTKGPLIPATGGEPE